MDLGVYHAEFYQSKSTFDEQQVVRDEKVGTRKISESFFEIPLDHGDPKKHKVTSAVTLLMLHYEDQESWSSFSL